VGRRRGDARGTNGGVGVGMQVGIVDSETLERSVGKLQRLVDERGPRKGSVRSDERHSVP
jgi:hypothetical protein